ncbi:MAG: tetratricopeptide repeat protein [Candidatus Sigynarchaeota archaeon]
MFQNPPFSAKELALISASLDAAGWKQRNAAGIKHRYFIGKKERVVNLTVVYPIEPNVKIKKDFYLFRFRFGLIASLGLINEDFIKKLFMYWAQKMKDIDVVFEQLPITEKIKGLDTSPDIKNRVKVEFVDKLPEAVEDKDENMFHERLRLFLATQKFTIDYATCKKIAAALVDLKLEPVNRYDNIFELQDGVSASFIDRLLVFKNPEYDEIVFLEPGYLTYYRDVEVENVRMRILVDSYAIEPMITLWKVDIAELLKDIIRSARAGLAACINATGIAEFTKVYFIKKNFDIYMKAYLKQFDPVKNADAKELAFPVPNTWHEILHTPNLVQPPWNLFTKPPETFEELQARRVYMESQRQGKQGNLSETVSALSQTLATFNKAGQKYAFYLVIVELARIAVKVGNHPECKAKYDLAMDFAIKSDGLVMPDEIMKLQEEYAEACVKFADYDNAVRQYTLLFNYLERARPETDSKRIDVLLKLNKIFINRNDFASLEFEIQKYFKQIKDFADKHKDKFILAAYYRVLGLYYEKKGKFSDALACYKRAMEEAANAGAIETELEAIIELGKNYLSGKKKNLEAAQKVLERGNTIVGKTDDLVKELKIYEMLEELYNQMNNYQLASHYNKESQRLRMALKSRGML